MEEHGVNFMGECVPIRRQEAEARGRVTGQAQGDRQVQSRHRVRGRVQHRQCVALHGQDLAGGRGRGVAWRGVALLYNKLERSGVDNIYAIGDVLVTTGCVYVYGTGGRLRAAVTGYSIFHL